MTKVHPELQEYGPVLNQPHLEEMQEVTCIIVTIELVEEPQGSWIELDEYTKEHI